jgi:hypothetical protein
VIIPSLFIIIRLQIDQSQGSMMPAKKAQIARRLGIFLYDARIDAQVVA